MDEKLLDELRQARAAAMNSGPEATGIPGGRRRTVLAEADPDDPGGAAADGVVAGAGEIDAQPIVVASYDRSVTHRVEPARPGFLGAPETAQAERYRGTGAVVRGAPASGLARSTHRVSRRAAER